MNRNVESHFSELPTIEIQRSMFDRSSSHKTSFNVGELIPFFLDEVLPGDTFNITTSCVCRLQTPLTPIMDNIYMDTYYFFVPCRILWTHWKEFMGENNDSAWLPAVSYSMPKTTPPSGGWNVGTIADYLGIPPGVSDSSSVMLKFPSSLPFRAYAMIADQWFRDQNVTDPINITLGDSNTAGSNGTNYITDTEKGGAPFKVSRFHDYFSSCLPAPQKGASVTFFNNQFNQGSVLTGYYVPVHAKDSIYNTANDVELRYRNSLNNVNYGVFGDTSGSLVGSSSGQPSGTGKIVPNNLWADVGAMAININDIRVAFQLQKFYEKCARGGTRYREVLAEHFSVRSSDARMMIPEYLGGHRFPLSIHQVTNQSSNSTEVLGDLGAMSNTSDVHEDFIKSFEEHGYVIGVCCARYDHTYGQGVERMWFRNTKLDYFWPVFQSIGEQPVFKYELMWTDTTTGYEVFGYQEPYAEYRYKPSRISGEMRPGIANSLATWHLADYYATVPTLSDAWMREDTATVDRVLSVAHTVSNQVFCDFYIKNITTRPMPMFGIPGLIDHH